MDKIRSFLWSRTDYARKGYNLVECSMELNIIWNQVCASTKEGGLDVL